MIGWIDQEGVEYNLQKSRKAHMSDRQKQQTSQWQNHKLPPCSQSRLRRSQCAFHLVDRILKTWIGNGDVWSELGKLPELRKVKDPPAAVPKVLSYDVGPGDNTTDSSGTKSHLSQAVAEPRNSFGQSAAAWSYCLSNTR